MIGWLGAAVKGVSSLLNIGEWFTKKKDQADQQEAGAAKQKSADQEEVLNAAGDRAKADAAMLDPSSGRAERVRNKFSRDGEGGSE